MGPAISGVQARLGSTRLRFADNIILFRTDYHFIRILLEKPVKNFAAKKKSLNAHTKRFALRRPNHPHNCRPRMNCSYRFRTGNQATRARTHIDDGEVQDALQSRISPVSKIHKQVWSPTCIVHGPRVKYQNDAKR